jgi:RNA polymerase sigma factor (sigma-70 family)
VESNVNPDKELVELAVSGSRKHQEQLYRLYADEMYNVCLMYSESEEDACDILQEAYIRVFRYLNTFQFESSLKTWIRRIIINTAINHYRKRKKDREFSQPLGENDDVAINDIFDNMNVNDIVQLVNELPEGAKMVLKLYAIEGYKHKEIAEIMEITEGTSKSQLNRAKSLLRETVEKLYGRKF